MKTRRKRLPGRCWLIVDPGSDRLWGPNGWAEKGQPFCVFETQREVDAAVVEVRRTTRVFYIDEYIPEISRGQ